MTKQIFVSQRLRFTQLNKLLSANLEVSGYAVAQLVEALRYNKFFPIVSL
jgi:hypothetical protein